MTTVATSAERPLWPLGIVLFGGVMLVTPVLVRTGLSEWAMPLLAGSALLWTYVQPDRSVIGFTFQRLRKMLVWLLVFAIMQAAMLSSDRVAAQTRAAAQEIVAMGESDPAAQAERLANADEAILAALGEMDPALREGEKARRNAAKAEANAPRIVELLEQDKKLEKDDIEGRVPIWRTLVSLAPGEAAYKTTLEELEEKKGRLDRIRANPAEGLEVVSFNWRKDGFGNVMVLDITLRNESDFPLRDFVINCIHSGPSGTVMDRNSRVLYEKLAAGGTHRFRNVNMGFIHSQAASSSCEVDGASVG
jgi:hypothetical protein